MILVKKLLSAETYFEIAYLVLCAHDGEGDNDDGEGDNDDDDAGDGDDDVDNDGDYDINSHNLFSWICIDVVRRKLVLITFGTQKIKELSIDYE